MIAATDERRTRTEKLFAIDSIHGRKRFCHQYNRRPTTTPQQTTTLQLLHTLSPTQSRSSGERLNGPPQQKREAEHYTMGHQLLDSRRAKLRVATTTRWHQFSITSHRTGWLTDTDTAGDRIVSTQTLTRLVLVAVLVKDANNHHDGITSPFKNTFATITSESHRAVVIVVTGANGERPCLVVWPFSAIAGMTMAYNLSVVFWYRGSYCRYCPCWVS